ncbi:hypothetical protein PISMIDRAFT_527620 [Pisolithus microcarpus 441]|uniref:Uncharacterized protein n=1 Tax=Pisolithus microcarpus 441 TaxID=765257 RepID=A0A0C9YYZ3_9AGAM|nr:hypothetical protein PISMIDRAFT_527620 [Pisolithus microcarpus 441]
MWVDMTRGFHQCNLQLMMSPSRWCHAARSSPLFRHGFDLANTKCSRSGHLCIFIFRVPLVGILSPCVIVRQQANTA